MRARNAGTAMTCDDGVSCTADSCDDGECTHQQLAGFCFDDGYDYVCYWYPYEDIYYDEYQWKTTIRTTE